MLEFDRPLAHIEKVISTSDIAGADRIGMTQVLDYYVVTKRDEFHVNDLVVYVEVDSILPDGLPLDLLAAYEALKLRVRKAAGEELAVLEQQMRDILAKNARPEFEFLRQKKFRIKAMKYNAFHVISQGIIFPLSILPADIIPSEGLDVTDALGIVKVIEDEEEIAVTEQYVCNVGGPIEMFLDRRFKRFAIYRNFKTKIMGPSRTGRWEEWMASPTDEENVQKIFTQMRTRFGDEHIWYVTSKIDGQSMSAYNHIIPTWFGLNYRTDFGVCSHGRHLVNNDGSQFWRTARQLDLQRKLKATGRNIMVQGEHAGGKIQGNIYKLPDFHMYLFTVWDLDKRRRYTYDEFMEFCQKFEFEHVPLVDDAFALPTTVQELLDYSNGVDELVPGVRVAREGIVIRVRDNPSISFKVRSPEYLVLHGK